VPIFKEAPMREHGRTVGIVGGHCVIAGWTSYQVYRTTPLPA
jgi:hypothetical protein